MIISRKSCSQPRSAGEQSSTPRPRKANVRAVASRELVSASLHLDGSGQPAECGEASIGREASTIRIDRTPRGERRQRAQTEPTGTWEARHSSPALRRVQPLKGSHNLQRGLVWESERPIVAEKSGLKSGWSQGALAKVTLSQKPLELIG